MAFENRKKAKTYQLRDGDTLQSIAERETAEGNPVTWQKLARFNWGTDEPEEVNAFMRDKLGSRRRSESNDFVISADDEPREQLLVPRSFTRGGLSVDKLYTLRIAGKKTPPQFEDCCHFPGITFGADSSFIRPEVAGYLKKLEEIARRRPDARIMIFGHTDAVGDELYNKKLSERRAWSAYAFIINDTDAWETLYKHEDEKWGLEEIQEMLADLGHYQGLIDGIWGPETEAAIRSLLGLPEGSPVQNDAAMRKELFSAYMSGKHDIELKTDRFMEPGYMGCGEFNRINQVEGKDEENRRVSFLFFHPDRPPALPCAFADIAPCGRQFVSLENRHKPGFKCSFYDSLFQRCQENPVPVDPQVSWISFELSNEDDGQPIAGAKYSLELPDGQLRKGVLGSDGKARLENIPEGVCILRFEDYHAADWDAEEDGDLPQPLLDENNEEEEEIHAEVLAQGDTPFLDDDPYDLPDDEYLTEI